MSTRATSGPWLDDQSLTPGKNPRLGAIRFEDWLGRQARAEAPANSPKSDAAPGRADTTSALKGETEMFTRFSRPLLLQRSSFTAALGRRPPAGKVTVVFDHALPNVPGKSMRGVLVEYGRAAGRPPTRIRSPLHLCDGARRRDPQQRQRLPGKGLSGRRKFYEDPGSRHQVSANASDTEPARLLAVFVLDTEETELTTPLKE